MEVRAGRLFQVLLALNLIVATWTLSTVLGLSKWIHWEEEERKTVRRSLTEDVTSLRARVEVLDRKMDDLMVSFSTHLLEEPR